MTKIKMKSGEKELKINHLAIYKLKQKTGKDITEYINKMQVGNVEMTAIYDLLFAGLKYKSIEEMLEDMEENEFSNYVEQVGKELGLLLGAGN